MRQPGKYASGRVVALDDGLWRGSRFYLNASARADRVAVRVRFALGGSKMAGPKIAHVDMLAGWLAVCEWRYDTRLGGFDSMASSSMPSTNRAVDTSTFLRDSVSE